MSSYKNIVPGGFYDSEEDSDEFDFGNGIRPARPTITKTVEVLMKEKLLELVELGDVGEIRKLLDDGPLRGMDIDELLDSRFNILFYACDQAQPEVIKFLVNERGANVNLTKEAKSPLMVLCNSSKDSEQVFNAVKELVQQSTNISAVDDRGTTALMFASYRGHAKVVEFLISQNDAIDALDNDGVNALFHAIEGRQPETAKILIDAGIDLTITASSRSHFAAQQYAEDEQVEEIVALFPKKEEEYVIPADFVVYNKFEDVIAHESSEIPRYFPEIAAILNASGCATFIEKFAQAKMSLTEFLTVTDERLEEIGIEFPFQRLMIQSGLSKFIQEPWKTSSLYIPPDFRDENSDIELMTMLGNILRQLAIVEAVLKNILLLPSRDIRSTERIIREFQSNVKILKKQQSAIHRMSRPLFIKNRKSSVGVWLTSALRIVTNFFSSKFSKN